MNHAFNSDQSVSILLDHQYLGNVKETLSQSSCSTSSVCSLLDTYDYGAKHEPETKELNANSIQKCFQNMLNMTALSDLDSRQQESAANLNGCKVVKFEVKLSNNTNATQPTFKVIPVSNTSGRKPEESVQIDTTMSDSLNVIPIEDEKLRKEWRKFNRDFQEEVRYNALLQYTMSLLVKKWAEYLAFTPDKMYEFELENARNSDLTDDVIEMLEDRDLHVWQILDMIDEM